MLYRMQNGKLLEEESISQVQSDLAAMGAQWVGVFSAKEAEAAAERFGISPALAAHALSNRSARFESHEGMDVICISLLRIQGQEEPFERVSIFFQKNLLLFMCENPLTVNELLERVKNDDLPDASLGRLLGFFFEYLIEKDSDRLEDLEQGIINLENEVIVEDAKRDCIHSIILLRKRLMVLKRYYEQLLGVLDYITGNENGLFDKASLRGFKILLSRVDRLYHSVLNLRDYVTQIREAYQSQVDIRLNEIMKVFTVITAIFLPLTLIAGWYGMNLDMPEYRLPFAYPAIIAVSLAVVAGCVVYFKKHKWF